MAGAHGQPINWIDGAEYEPWFCLRRRACEDPGGEDHCAVDVVCLSEMVTERVWCARLRKTSSAHTHTHGLGRLESIAHDVLRASFCLR